jgi:hypothetical protein
MFNISPFTRNFFVKLYLGEIFKEKSVLFHWNGGAVSKHFLAVPTHDSWKKNSALFTAQFPSHES